MKWLIAVFLFFLLLLQFSLWFGNGGLLRVLQLNQSVEMQKSENSRLKERNEALEAEVRDLKKGLEAIEERARTELGMIKKGETFFQVIEEQ